MKRVYFPNLNGIRFIAAFLVIIHHIEQIKHLLGMESHWDSPFIYVVGKLGVTLFFVLSGFLITYLLLIEEELKGSISVRKFYVRRILRIWPLYYLIIALSFLLLPYIPFFDLGELSEQVLKNVVLKVLLFVFFLPNLVLGLFPPVPYASQTWSVGLEEQFYLVWPILMKKTKHKMALFGIIVFGFLIIKFLIYNVLHDYLVRENYFKMADVFFQMPFIDCMAIGGVLALLLYEKHNLLRFVFAKTTQWAVYALLGFLIIKGVTIPFIHYEFYGALFGIMILNLAANEQSILRLERQPFHYLGKISYGIYMYHPIAIIACIKSLQSMGITNNFALYGSSILVTTLIAGLSYRYFEEYFIRKKSRFTDILSGEQSYKSDSVSQPGSGKSDVVGKPWVKK